MVNLSALAAIRPASLGRKIFPRRPVASGPQRQGVSASHHAYPRIASKQAGCQRLNYLSRTGTRCLLRWLPLVPWAFFPNGLIRSSVSLVHQCGIVQLARRLRDPAAIIGPERRRGCRQDRGELHRDSVNLVLGSD